MSLIADIKKLRELEQQAHYPYLVYVMPDMKTPCYCRTEEDARYVQVSRNLAPAMLEVLGCHEEYDSVVLKAMKFVLIGAGVQGGSPMMNVLDRNIRAAALMEKEEQ